MAEAGGGPRAIAAFLWLWLAVSFAAYLWQFRGLVRPVVGALREACRQSLPFCS